MLSRCRAGIGYVVLAAFHHPWLVQPAEFAIQAAAGAAVLAHFSSFFPGSWPPTLIYLLFGCLCGPVFWTWATARVWRLVEAHLPAALRTYLADWHNHGLTSGELAPSERCRLQDLQCL